MFVYRYVKIFWNGISKEKKIYKIKIKSSQRNISKSEVYEEIGGDNRKDDEKTVGKRCGAGVDVDLCKTENIEMEENKDGRSGKDATRNNFICNKFYDLT